jgi:hypothetical protein
VMLQLFYFEKTKFERTFELHELTMKNLNKKFLLFLGTVIILFAVHVHADKNNVHKSVFAQVTPTPLSQEQIRFVAGDAGSKEQKTTIVAVNDQIVEEEEDFKDDSAKKEKSDKPLVSAITGFVISLLNYHIIHHFYENVEQVSANPIYILTSAFRL